jgi:hypothetical protein
MPRSGQHKTPPPLVAALVVLAERGIPTDVQDLLVAGDPMRGIAPGALEAAIEAAQDAAEEAERISNTCDEPGCSRPACCGWPSPSGYRRTCFAHWVRL